MLSSFKRFSSNLVLAAMFANLLVFNASATSGVDTDADGMFDSDEATYGYDATNPDQDFNGIIDGVDDFDSDGISNADEIYTTFTNPDAWDTDEDGRSDGAELVEGTDPNISELPNLELMDFDLDPADDTILITVENIGTYAITGVSPTVSLYTADDGLLVETFDMDTIGTGYRSILGSNTFNSVYTLDPSLIGVNMTIVLDSNNDVIESDENNTTTTIIRRDVSDLYVSDLSLSSSNEVIYTAKNIGGQSINASTLSANKITVDGVDVFDAWTDMSDLSWLASDAFTTEPAVDVTSSVVLTSGTHTVEVCLDSTELVSEFSETNNCITEEFTVLPDLVITSVTINSDNTLHFVIANQGTAEVDPADAPELRFYDQTNGDGSADEIFLLNGLGSSYLAVGGTMEFNSLYQVPSTSTTVTILATVDATGTVTELSDDNDYRATLSLVLPDLTVSNVQLWSTDAGAFVALADVPAGADPVRYAFYYTVGNIGDADVGDADSTVVGFTKVTQDGSEVISYDWTDLGTWDFLVSDGTSSFSADEVTVSNESLVGRDTLSFCVDSTSLITESNEENNCYTLDNPFVEVSVLPDLVITSVTVNSDNTLHFTVKNEGTAAVDSESTPTLNFYDQTNGDGSVNETFSLNTYGTAYQAIDGTVEFNSTYVLPTTSTTVTILAVVDPANDIEELTEDTFEANYYRATLSVNMPTTTTSGGGAATGVFGGGSSGGGSSSGHTTSSGSSTSGGSSTTSSGDSVILSSSEDVVLTAEEVTACGAMTFLDVSTDDVNYDDIYRMWCEGVVHGRDAEHFVPADAIKRDEASKIVARIFGYVTEDNSALPEVTSTSYSDVATTEVLAYYIQTLTDGGFYVDEATLGVFRPHENMTYAEAIHLIRLVSGVRLSLDGYTSTSTVSRGDFATLAFSLFQ